MKRRAFLLGTAGAAVAALLPPTVSVPEVPGYFRAFVGAHRRYLSIVRLTWYPRHAWLCLQAGSERHAFSHTHETMRVMLAYLLKHLPRRALVG